MSFSGTKTPNRRGGVFGWPSCSRIPRRRLNGNQAFRPVDDVAVLALNRASNPKLRQCRDAFNVLNHVNYTNVINVTGSTVGIANPQFGQPNSANPGRRLQLNLTYKF